MGRSSSTTTTSPRVSLMRPFSPLAGGHPAVLHSPNMRRMSVLPGVGSVGPVARAATVQGADMKSIRNISIATAAGIALVVGGGAVAANAATPAPSAAAAVCSVAQLKAEWAKAPAELKSDLKALKAMPAGKD